METLKTILNSAVSELIPDKSKKVALFLSGGIDSFTLAVTLKELAIPVQAYTFRIDGVNTKDTVTAERNAQALGIDWNTVEISSENLENDFLELANTWGCKKKTEFECTWPFTKLFPFVKEDTIVSGVTADTLYGSSKKVAINFSKPKEVFDGYRRTALAQPNIEGYKQIKAIAAKYNKTAVLPFRHESVQEYFMSLDYPEIHRPGKKGLAKVAFKEYFDLIGGKINSRNLQLAAEIPVIFERLLTSKLNKYNRTRVADLCKDYAQL